jgi:hypothetical protein
MNTRESILVIERSNVSSYPHALELAKKLKNAKNKAALLEAADWLLGSARLVADPKATRRLRRIRRRFEKNYVKLEKEALEALDNALKIQRDALHELEEKHGIVVKIKHDMPKHYGSTIELPANISPKQLSRIRSQLIKKQHAMQEELDKAYGIMEWLLKRTRGDDRKGPIERGLASRSLEKISLHMLHSNIGELNTAIRLLKEAEREIHRR